MEIRLKKDKSREILDKCGFSEGLQYLREGLSGGLVLAWMPQQKLHIVHASKHLVHTNLWDNKGNPLSITFIYGHPKESKRDEVWMKLRSFKLSAHSNWLCNGDFNQVLNEDDKFSIHRETVSGADSFQQLISYLGSCEVIAFGQKFTWMNRRDGEDFVMERLDSGDLLVTYQLKNKLSDVRKDLIHWNKQVFGKVEDDIRLKQAQLQSIQNSIHTVDDVRKETLFREELETLIHREEVTRSQKARCNWVVLRDRNTRYFQTVVKQRRARSKILQLKTDDGEVIEDQGRIEQLLLQHFKQSYRRTTTTNVDHILKEIKTLPISQISNQQNLALTTPVTNEEIEFTTFRLGSFKSPGPDGIPAFFY
ncbi:uncharacterized protein LOC142616298 [Castanea sativa]|uniref:uncharacterized protein LOC142616298 n=1 Tax=Castanea sativa TaxID=21020 RepID=UPI003F65117E